MFNITTFFIFSAVGVTVLLLIKEIIGLVVHFTFMQKANQILAALEENENFKAIVTELEKGAKTSDEALNEMVAMIQAQYTETLKIETLKKEEIAELKKMVKARERCVLQERHAW